MQEYRTNWQKAILPVTSSIHEAIGCLDDTSLKIILVVEVNGLFLGTVTDGDIRRGILRGISLDDPLSSIFNNQYISCNHGLPKDKVLDLMRTNAVQQIPVIDSDNTLIGLHSWDFLETLVLRPNCIVVMAGGIGSRLNPYTENCPKPMLQVMGKPILEHIVEKGKAEGFRKFIFTVRYLAHMIEEYFGNGQDFGVEIEYLHEAEPLGTAGALSLLRQQLSLPFVLTNGDVLTNLSYGDLLDFHLSAAAQLTMGVRMHEIQNPFGVVEIIGEQVISYQEKPIIRSFINAGIYALDPKIIDLVPENQAFDMPELFTLLRLRGGAVVAYPLYENWIDIGRPSDFEFANLGFNHGE